MSQSSVASAVPMNRARKPQNMIACMTPGYACERADLAERVSQNSADALGDPIQPIFGEPAPPQTHPLPHAVREDRDRERAADVERHLSPAGDVPEGVTEGNGRGHERLNLSTGAEEGADGTLLGPTSRV